MSADLDVSTRSACVPAAGVVSIDPAKVLDLATGLADASDRANRLAGLVAARLTELGEDALLVRPVQAFAVWCDVERVAVRAAAEAILSLEAGPAPACLGGLSIVHAPDRPEFASPVPSVEAAAAALAALDADDPEGFSAVVEGRSGDAVFAAVLVEALGAARLAAELDHLAALTGSGLDDERRRHERAVAAMADVVATARATQGSSLTVGDLVAAIPDRPPGEVALLFVGSTVFDAAFLLDAFERLVEEPLGTADDGVWVASGVVDGERDARDSTTLVLRALERSAGACTRLLLDADPQRLLVDTAYRDGGAALADVLDTGTDPSSGDPAAPRAALHVITWVADRVELGAVGVEHGPALAAGTQVGLGRVAARYIGSFRADRLDDVVVDPVSDQLRAEISDTQADRFLSFAARQEEAADRMRAALLEWASSGVGRIAGDADVPVAPFTVVGDVGRRVSDAVESAAVSWSAPIDRRRDNERALWSMVAGAASNLSGRIDPSGLAVSVAGSALVDRFAPEGHAELDAAKGQARALSGDQLRLEQITLSGLWEQRARNHLFDAASPPPELVDGSRLRTLPEIEEDDALDVFERWLEQLAEHGVAHLDRLGAEFGSTGARRPG